MALPNSAELKDIARISIDSTLPYEVWTNREVSESMATIFRPSDNFSQSMQKNNKKSFLCFKYRISNFNTISDDEWSETAVRKVLQTFAYGGHATDLQIKTWASMNPKTAIKEMLNVEPNNYKLSPSDPLDKDELKGVANLQDLAEHIYQKRDSSIYFNPGWQTPSDSSVPRNWALSVFLRGLNPFMSKMGMWETNYHIAANQDALFWSSTIYNHYDSIMGAYRENRPYEEIIASGAGTTGTLAQYGTLWAKYYESSDTFKVNEDFAREYHQLLFGNLGQYDIEYHEYVAIKNTAKALTGYLDPKWHYKGELDILNETISGDDFNGTLHSLSKVSINHPESLQNLPIIIIKGLADDHLDEYSKDMLRKEWASMEKKDIIKFLQNYAISDIFHSENRVKYMSSIDRSTKFWSKLVTKNQQLYMNDYFHFYLDLNKEGIKPFYLRHHVFGHQTGIESANSIISISSTISALIKSSFFWTTRVGWGKDESGENKVLYVRDWEENIPKSSNGEYIAKDIAEWLWIDFFGDLKHFGTIEKAHTYALLNGQELSLFINPDLPDRVYTLEELESGDIKAKIDELASKSRTSANHFKIEEALGFFNMLPQSFIQEGK